MRAGVAVLLLVCAACTTTSSSDAGRDGGPDYGEPAPCSADAPPSPSPDACDAPPHVDPASVADWDGFLAAASALVCDASLRCTSDSVAGLGWVLAQSFCNPGFARLRGGAAVLPAVYDVRAGRACLDALTSARGCGELYVVANRCRELLRPVAPGAPCSGTSDCSGGFCDGAAVCTPGTCVGWSYEGAGCGVCAPGLVCEGSRCVGALHTCEPCGSDVECGVGSCVLGACATGAPERASCRGVACADDLWCDDTFHCVRPPGAGADGGAGAPCPIGSSSFFDTTRCTTQHHLGCACAADADCPYDVSRCIAGTCVARPMPGDACTPGGAPCFASACDGGTCGPVPPGGTCSDSSECVAGLVCGDRVPGLFGPAPGVCRTPTMLGEHCTRTPCGPGLACVGEYCATAPPPTTCP